MRQFELKLHNILQTLIKTNYVLSIIQFGSSIRRKTDNDIDLAIILKGETYNKLFKKLGKFNIEGFDISVIKEEELKNLKQFKFGSHGLHFAKSLKNGKILYGPNPFLKINLNRFEIKKSIINRLYDYIYNVRKEFFSKNINISIKQRWPKFLRLCLYLINDNLIYPDVLDLNTKQVNKFLKQNGIRLPKNLLLAYETIWEKVLKKEQII